jgi:hypothetical protein
MAMKILVTKGMITCGKKLYKLNQTADVDKEIAERFVRLGVATLLKETAAEPEEPAPEEPKAPQVDPVDADDDADDNAGEEIVKDLPPVDPTAGVKKGGKKGGKK